MNKEIISKYKTEFDHWLNGGKLLYTYPSTCNWGQCKADHPWVDIQNSYIINDEYVQFRKALAEGIPVETDIGSTDTWVNIKNSTYFKKDGFVGDLKHYRIKVVPNFQVGDFIIHNFIMWSNSEISKKEILQVEIVEHNVIKCTNGLEFNIPNTNIKLWKPKVGEYIWDYEFGLAVVEDVSDDEDILCKECYNHKQRFKESLKNIQPFIGNLPTNLKDK